MAGKTLHIVALTDYSIIFVHCLASPPRFHPRLFTFFFGGGVLFALIEKPRQCMLGKTEQQAKLHDVKQCHMKVLLFQLHSYTAIRLSPKEPLCHKITNSSTESTLKNVHWNGRKQLAYSQNNYSTKKLPIHREEGRNTHICLEDFLAKASGLLDSRRNGEILNSVTIYNTRTYLQ